MCKKTGITPAAWTFYVIVMCLGKTEALGHMIDKIIPETAEIIPETAEIILETAEIIPETAEIIPETAEIILETAEIIPEDKYLLPENGYLLPENEYLLPENEYLLPENEYLRPSESYLSPEQEYLPSEDLHVSQEELCYSLEDQYLIEDKKSFDRLSKTFLFGGSVFYDNGESRSRHERLEAVFLGGELRVRTPDRIETQQSRFGEGFSKMIGGKSECIRIGKRSCD